MEYQPDGMTANIWKQYVNSPNSFAELRKAILQVPGLTLKYRYKTAAHYVASCLLARKPLRCGSSDRLLILAGIPVGIVLSAVIRIKGHSA